MTPVFQQGKWSLINDISFEVSGPTIIRSFKVVTAMHACNPSASKYKSLGKWLASDNVQNGACFKCGDPVPEEITTIWKLLNFERLAE